MELLLSILVASWAVMGEMAPYLLLGFLVAGILSVFVSPLWVERHLGDGRLGQVFKASLFGVPLPLCSCGVIPVAASLRRHGAGKGATTAFLLSTPQTGVDSIAVTYALLGPFLAVYRPVAALVTGFVGGGLVHALDRDRPGETPPAATPAADDCAGSCAPSTDEGPRLLRALRYGFLTLPRDIGKALIVGVLLSGVISALIPADALRGVLGAGVLPVLAAMAVGVPLYVCATASVPIAVALIHAGLSPGAALAFLISGPATNAATLTTLWRVLGRRPMVIFLLTVAVGALVSGLVVDAVVATGVLPASAIVSGAGEVAGHVHPAAEGIPWHHHVAAIALLVVLAAALWPRRGAADEPTATEAALAEQRELQIAGMHCNGCVQSITRALSECPGVASVQVDLDAGTARVTGTGLDPGCLTQAVTGLGFEVRPAEG